MVQKLANIMKKL